MSPSFILSTNVLIYFSFRATLSSFYVFLFPSIYLFAQQYNNDKQ